MWLRSGKPEFLIVDLRANRSPTVSYARLPVLLPVNALPVSERSISPVDA